MIMKALTICQPFAWGCVFGPKDVENRSWRIHHRGWLAIHAGLSRAWLDRCRIAGRPGLYLNDGTKVPENELVYGAVIGLVKVTRCVEPRDLPGNPHAEGPWCHVYAERRPLLKPFFCTGQRSLWDVDIPDEYFCEQAPAVVIKSDRPTQIKPANAGGCRLVDLPGGGHAFVCSRRR